MKAASKKRKAQAKQQAKDNDSSDDSDDSDSDESKKEEEKSSQSEAAVQRPANKRRRVETADASNSNGDEKDETQRRQGDLFDTIARFNLAKQETLVGVYLDKSENTVKDTLKSACDSILVNKGKEEMSYGDVTIVRTRFDCKKCKDIRDKAKGCAKAALTVVSYRITRERDNETKAVMVTAFNLPHSH